ncbi:MAG: carboxypeptidase regulatory-like domain-containing protein [Bacteroidota bacterium]
MSGKIIGADEQGLEGATIVAIHTPSGTEYGAVSLEGGRFNIPNMRIGGPYSVTISFIGYEARKESNIYLVLGERYRLNSKLVESGVTLDEVVIEDVPDLILNSERTGAETNIDRSLIDNLPTISRSAADYTRLNPMSAEGGSFAGRNDQFNNYSLDGSIFNNPFGLDAATPGGQTDAQPISLDAIDQISVAIAPFDVTQSGFTGAAINAVTKSGTNEFHGTVFGYLTNSSMIGGSVDGTDVETGDLSSVQAGFSLGGPIVKNKAFFFANLEFQQRSDLGSYFVPDAGTSEDNVSRVSLSDMQLVSDLLRDNYGYETGALTGFKHDANNVKGILKLDVNLNKNNKLTASYNFLDAFKDKPAHPSAIGRRGPDFQTLQFQNSGYRINNRIHSGIIELKSFISSKFSNKLQVGYTAFRDFRDPFSEPFPVLNIGKDGVRYIIAGHEPFSVNNVLDQDVFQVNNTFNIYTGKHTWTLGANFERFDFNNSFNLTAYGFRVFGPDVDIADFEAFINSGDFDAEVDAARQAFTNNNENNSWALAETNLGQLGIYGQDEIAVNDKLNLTLGVRLEFPLYFNTPELIQENIDRKGGLTADGGVYSPEVTYYDENGEALTFDHTELPSSNPLINPRVGFNYDVKGDRSMQLRGGTGFFSGRFPFVWIGNQVANPDFFFYNMTDPDFRYPQVWKTNLGYDQKFGGGWVSSVDLIYTKDLQAQMVRNFGLITPRGTLEGVDNRPIYLDTDRAQGPFGGSTNAYVFTNTDAGYSFNASFQLERSWQTAFLKLGYNYLVAQDAASIEAEISSDAYDRNPANVQNTNTAELAPAFYGNQHRFLAVFSKRFVYGNMGTTISLFGEMVQGGRFSYTYSGDINNDGSGLNDLIYIPTDAEIDQMQFAGTNAAAQRTALKAYIGQDEYLSDNRGTYAEKYGALSPWYGKIDLRILQDLYLPNDQKIQLSIDVLNFGNLINDSWGVRQQATFTGLAQPIGVSVDDGNPVYSFDTSQTQTFFNDFSLLSRWQLQLGLRYEF